MHFLMHVSQQPDKKTQETLPCSASYIYSGAFFVFGATVTSVKVTADPHLETSISVAQLQSPVCEVHLNTADWSPADQ